MWLKLGEGPTSTGRQEAWSSRTRKEIAMTAHTTTLAGSVAQFDGKLVLPEHGHWDEARQAWNLAVDQRPAAVALPESAEDVAAVIEVAKTLGLRVAPQGTGHGAAPLGALDDTVLLKTERMRAVEIDREARIARVEAGVRAIEVVEAAAQHGLAMLAGSSPDVGVVGYTLGGGLSWFSRKYGLASSNVQSIEVITADGRHLRAGQDSEPDLFWALRGGGGSFGIVTALELRLFPIENVYAGILWWPIERGGEVLHAWAELTRNGLPDELTTVGRYLRFPPIPDIPEPVRGKSFVVVQAIHLGDPAQADELLSPLRALGPAMDTIQVLPIPALSQLHMDPDHPVPGTGDGLILSELPPAGVDELVRVAGTTSGSPLLSVEVRQLGGELRHARPDHGALAAIDGDYGLYAVGITPTPEAATTAAAHLENVKNAMTPWAAEQTYLNFAETPLDPRTLWTEQAYRRLRQIKAAVDPTNMIRSNHPIDHAD
jgi:hypothetical protein